MRCLHGGFHRTDADLAACLRSRLETVRIKLRELVHAGTIAAEILRGLQQDSTDRKVLADLDAALREARQ